MTACSFLAVPAIVEEWGMSQFVRDVRISLIYEGTNGIQALDLVGRKLMADGGRAWQTWFAEIDQWIEDNQGNEDLTLWIDGLRDTKALLVEGTQWMGANAMSNFDNAGAGSHDYLHLFGLTAFAWMWAMMAKEALEKKDSGDPYYANKLITGRYFVERMLPEAPAHLAKMKTGAESMMALDAANF